MAESVMRQGLTTWLKKECQGAGESMIYAILGADTAQTEALRLAIPNLESEQARYIAGSVEYLVRSAVSSMTNLPLSLLTVEERQEVFEVKSEIEELLRAVTSKDVSGRPELMESLVGKLYGLNLTLRQLLLEKVVECQCGRSHEIVMLEVGDRVKVISGESEAGREGAIVEIPYGTNLYKVHLDGDVSTSTWRHYEVELLGSKPEIKGKDFIDWE